MSPSLLWFASIFAIVLPLLLAYLGWRFLRPVTNQGARIKAVAGTLVVCLCAQVAALGAVFLYVNDDYQFYTSWGDLLGRTGPIGVIQTSLPMASAGTGKLKLITVHGPKSHTTAQVLVWLPQQYDQPQYKHYKFPVVEFLPGQPNTPGGAFEHFDLGKIASELIDTHKLAPFVMVVPPLMIRPPVDTECTNVPHGPQALTWLRTEVPHGVVRQLRVQPPGPSWSLMGWSTGGFCAAKLMFQHDFKAGAAVSFGGYMQPNMHYVIPHIFGGSKAVRDRNDPTWLYSHYGLRGSHMLLISGQQDPTTWPSTKAFLAKAKGNTDVGYIAFQSGGHNLADYAAYTSTAFLWLKSVGTLG